MTPQNTGRYIALIALSIVAVIVGLGCGISIIVLVNTFSLPWLISTVVCLILLLLTMSGIRRLQSHSSTADKMTSRLVIGAIAIGILAVPTIGIMLLFHK